MLLVMVFLVFPSMMWAQVPIEPLRRPEEGPGAYTWRAGLGYTPAGQEGLGVDGLGRPYAYTRFTQEWRLTLSGTVSLGSWLKAGLELADITTTVEEARSYPFGEERTTSVHRAFAYSASYEWRLDPKSPWDPRASLSFGYPWQAGITAQASLLRDPVVLVGDVGLRSQAEEPQGWLSLALGAGFVANAWITLSTSASWAIPMDGVGVPATTLGLRVRYGLDPEGKKEVGVRVTLSVRGDRTWLALEVEAAGRGP